MIVAGIDEAGYGPLLGPLVVGCCAFRIEEDASEYADGGGDSRKKAPLRKGGASPADASRSLEDAVEKQLPCIWKRLGKVVSKKRVASGKKLHVNDSKLVYSPADGLRELERSVLAILCASDLIASRESNTSRENDASRQNGAPTHPSDLPSLLSVAANHVLQDMPEYAWYQPAADERFPLEQEMLPIRIFANAVRAEMNRTRTFCVDLSARIVLERQLNRMMQATRNKASALFSTGAIHIDRLLKKFGEQNLVIFCDRQGGREHYGALLRLMFEEWSLEVLKEGEDGSDYALHKSGHIVRIIFREKAEQQCLSVALASMLSKYLREAMMRRFNAFWASHIPDVIPTAGYYQDGTRFLRDIEPKRAELRIGDEQLIRSR